TLDILVPWRLFHEFGQAVDLRAVGGDDAQGMRILTCTYRFEKLLHLADHQRCFFFVVAAEGFRILRFVEAASRCVDEFHRLRTGDQGSLPYRFVGDEVAVIEVSGREFHDVFVHPVLHLQHGGGGGLSLNTFFKQRCRQARACGLTRFDRRRQLTMVAGKYHTSGADDGYPAGRLKRLGSLVDENGFVLAIPQQRMGSAYEGTGYYVTVLQKVVYNVELQYVGVGFECLRLLQQRASLTLFRVTVFPFEFECHASQLFHPL